MSDMREYAAGTAPAQVRMSEVLGAFSLASDLAVGLHPEHAARSCYIGMHIAEALGLSAVERTLYRTGFLGQLLDGNHAAASTGEVRAARTSDGVRWP